MINSIGRDVCTFHNTGPVGFLGGGGECVPTGVTARGSPRGVVLSGGFEAGARIYSFVGCFFDRFVASGANTVGCSFRRVLIPSTGCPGIGVPTIHCSVVSYGDGRRGSSILRTHIVTSCVGGIVSDNGIVQGSSRGLEGTGCNSFTVLLHNIDGTTIFVGRLERRKVPISVSLRTFTRGHRVSAMLSLLGIVSGIRTSIRLLSLVLSPVFTFSASSLTRLETRGAGKDLCSTIMGTTGGNGFGTASFVGGLRGCHLLSMDLGLPSLVSHLLGRARLLGVVATFPSNDHEGGGLLVLVRVTQRCLSGNAGGLKGFMDCVSGLSGSNTGSTSVGDNGSIGVVAVRTSGKLRFPIYVITNASGHFGSDSHGGSTYCNAGCNVNFGCFSRSLGGPVSAISHRTVVSCRGVSALRRRLELLCITVAHARSVLLFMSTFRGLRTTLRGCGGHLMVRNYRVASNFFRCASDFTS